jgi:hypothetical protein
MSEVPLYQLGEPGLFPTPKSTELYRIPSMSLCEFNSDID